MEDKKNMSHNDLFRILGQNIRKARLTRGLSQENLANELDKTLNFISLLENGKTGISVPTLVDICETLDVNISTLFEGILSLSVCEDDQFISDTIHILETNDKKAIRNLLNYIVELKTK